jgi:hypothetical protein
VPFAERRIIKMDKLTLLLAEEDYELKDEIERLGCKMQESQSEFFNGDIRLITILIEVMPCVIAGLTPIIVAALTKYKKSRFKYKGIDMTGYSAEEVEKILTIIAQNNNLDDEKKK